MQQVRTEYLSIRDAVRIYPFSDPTFRWWVSQCAKNGFDKVIARIEGRIYLKRAELDRWLESHTPTSGVR